MKELNLLKVAVEQAIENATVRMFDEKTDWLDEEGNTVENPSKEEIISRLNSGVIQIAGRFDESTDQDTTGYVIGEFTKVLTGPGLAETNE